MTTYRLIQARTHDDPVRADEHASFAKQLGAPLEDVRTFNVLYETATIDELTEGVNAVLVGGSGAFSVLDAEPWIPRFQDLLGGIADRQFPLFASCFGFQALVVALGGTVESREIHSELGTHDISLTEHADGDALFSGLPGRFAVQQGHKDSATKLPSNTTLLAGSERCPYQAIRVGDGPVYACQFHPELTQSENRQRFDDYGAHYNKAVEKARMQAVLESFRPSPHASEILARFAARVGDS